MTKCGAGMTKWGAGMTKWGAGALGRPAWPPMHLEALPHSSPPLWIPAFAGMTKWASGACQAKSWYKSLQVGLYASISLIFQALFPP